MDPVKNEELQAARARERVKLLSKRERQMEMANFLVRVQGVAMHLDVALRAVHSCEILGADIDSKYVQALDHMEGLIRLEYKRTYGVDFGGIPDA